MHANANLADEVHDYQQRFLAEERARQKSDELLAAKESAPPDHLATRASEWARLAREGRIRVRLPCASWESYGHSEVRSLHGGTFAVSGRRGDARQRALDAGLTDAEVEAIPETYDRARRRTWASIASTCEANEAFTSSVASMDIPADDLERRIRVCAAHVLRVYEEPTQRAIERVGELRAEGATIARAEGPEQRVLFGLTEASDHLTEELVRTFGREKATQVFDYGLVCTDEMVFKSRG